MVERGRYAEGEPCWAEVTAADIGAAKRFYGAVFGWTFVDTGDRYGSYVLCLKNGEAVAALTSPITDDGAPPVWNTYLKTADADTTAQRVPQSAAPC
jgi:uncharacterized protein